MNDGVYGANPVLSDTGDSIRGFARIGAPRQGARFSTLQYRNHPIELQGMRAVIIGGMADPGFPPDPRLRRVIPSDRTVACVLLGAAHE